MRRMLLILISAGALAATAIVATAGAASPTTLQLVSAQQTFVMDPNGDPAVGSRMIFTDALFNRTAQFGKPAGARVGSAEIVCTIVSRSKAQCSVTAHLPNGEVVAMGALSTSNNGVGRTHFAIVGGAGAYAAASGSADGRDVSQTKTLLTLRLR